MTNNHELEIVTRMISDVWLDKAADFRPGMELYRSERTFQLLGYAASHSQLLLSSDRGSDGERCETTIQILFKSVEAIQIQECYRGLVITCATEAEAERINASVSDYGYRAADARVFVLKSQGVRGYVVSPAIGWREDVLSRMQASLFTTVSPYDPVWPTAPVFGVNGGLTIASPAEVAQVVLAGADEQARRDRHRYTYVLTARTAEYGRRPVGVFLSDADAMEAAELLGPGFSSWVIEEVPIVL